MGVASGTGLVPLASEIIRCWWEKSWVASSCWKTSLVPSGDGCAQLSFTGSAVSVSRTSVPPPLGTA